MFCEARIVIWARFSSEYVRRVSELGVKKAHISLSMARAFRILRHLHHGGSKQPGRASEKVGRVRDRANDKADE
jgi:hypothetical protein